MIKLVKKEEWEELIRSDFFLYNISIACHSIQYSNEFLQGPRYEKILLYVKGNVGRYYENFADHHRVGNYCMKKFLGNGKLFSDYLKFWMDVFKKFNKTLAKAESMDIKKLSNKELAKLLNEVYRQSIYWEGVAYNVDAIDTVLNPLIQGVISKQYKGKSKTEQSLVYNKLTFPDVLSYANRFNYERLKLVLDIKKNGIKKCSLKIDKFISNYFWINFKWGESKFYTRKNLLNYTKKINVESVKKDFVELKDQLKKAKVDKYKLVKEIAKKYLLIKKYIMIFDEYAVLHDLRKEGQVKASHQIRRLFWEAAKRFKVKKELLYYYWPFEVVDILADGWKVDVAKLKMRQKEWFCEYNYDGEWNESFGTDALKKRDMAIGLEDELQKELSGIGASQGIVFGKAKICLSAKEAIKRIKKGDILVTGMTMPDFVPAMKKAAAIVTDEGGLTCHAAIIARELGVPCVVGTKMATRTIKEGDLVEVNANHGVVKILK